jgi:hypothetical protein
MTSQTACKTSAADAVTSADALMVASAEKIYKSDHHTMDLVVTDLWLQSLGIVLDEICRQFPKSYQSTMYATRIYRS